MNKQRNPWWYPPTYDAWAKGLKPVPPGPGNPLGTRWMGLDAPGVGIHGTDAPASIGYSASHGCIRMHVPDAEWLFEHVHARDARGHSLAARQETPSQVSTATTPTSATSPPMQPRMPRLAHRRRANARPSRISTPPTRPGADDERGQQDDQALPAGGGGEEVHYHGIVPESLPSPDANYSSGNDYVVEFLGYRFSFSGIDFEGRVVAAAVKLGVVETPELDEDETADLVALAAQGLIEEPASRASAATSSATGSACRSSRASRSSTGCAS